MPMLATPEALDVLGIVSASHGSRSRISTAIASVVSHVIAAITSHSANISTPVVLTVPVAGEVSVVHVT